MPNQLRFRSGLTQLIQVPVDSATVIEAGDVLWLNTDDARPASAFAWDTDLATTQDAFAGVFLGIAHEPSPAGESGPITVDISPLSVYEMDCVSANYVVGQILAPSGTQPALKDQLLASATGDGMARCVESRTAATTIRVTFASACSTASSNANATPN